MLRKCPGKNHNFADFENLFLAIALFLLIPYSIAVALPGFFLTTRKDIAEVFFAIYLLKNKFSFGHEYHG